MCIRDRPNGLASLDAAGKLEQMPTSGDIGAISTTEKGVANGIATLDASGKVVQNPASAGVANGLATLDTDVYKRQELSEAFRRTAQKAEFP